MIDDLPPRFGQAKRSLTVAAALWREGLVPEAEAAVLESLRLLLDAWAATADPPVTTEEDPRPPATQDGALAVLAKAGYPRVDRLREALDRRVSEPQVYARSPSSNRPETELVLAEAERLWAFTSRRRRSRAARKRLRIRATIGIGVLAVLAVAFIVRAWFRPLVTASAIYAPEYQASYAFDGIDTTEWLLPDHTTGWLQIRLPFARRIRSVRILNAHNKFYMDRAAQEVRVTAYSKDGAVGTASGKFASLTADPSSALDLPLQASGVTHLRVEVLSYFGTGGGLAEVEPR